jgi:hypothetical protein
MRKISISPYKPFPLIKICFMHQMFLYPTNFKYVHIFHKLKVKKTYYGDCVVCMGYSFYSTIQKFKNSQKIVTIEISILNILHPFCFDD